MNQHLHNPHLNGSPFLLTGAATGNGRVGVLLMHGLTATPYEVRALAERLHQDAGYTVAGPLLPGHGASPAALNATRWQDWLETAVAEYHLLATICDRVFVGGESTGAVLGLYLAATYPEVAGVLAYSPAIRLQLGRLDHLKLRLGAPFVTAVAKESIDAAANWQGYPVNPLRAAVELLRLQQATLPRLSRVTQPVLVVQGAHDITIHPRSGRIILDAVRTPHKELHHMADSSHVVLLDRELEAILTLTRDFLSRSLNTV